ncbi:MAG TPA: TIGR03560 family F420-dependent LLM class oxidoreductase [Acidimicrobiales bacterium]|jgi:F420-dependent oxidoreductase-like protein|nr:TIGR03560 family F420-dependent LLM class oxidoreductase [Acidimicrobiales bacterium]
MRFSLWLSPGHTWDELVALAGHAERTGWDGIWFPDHFMGAGRDAGGDLLECWSVLAALAAAVPRVRIGSLVSGNMYRHPAVLANVAAAVDRISGGRVVLGIGAGWQRNEHEKYGIEFSDVGGRLDRLEEACQVIRSLTTTERTTHRGRYYQLDDAPMEPKPVQSPLPLLIGGGGERRTLRIAARFADEWNTWGTPDIVAHKSTVLAQHCEALDRDPATIGHSAQAIVLMGDDQQWLSARRSEPQRMPTIVGTPSELAETVGGYQQVGLDELVVPDWTFPRGGETDWLDRFIEDVASPYRSTQAGRPSRTGSAS